MKTGKRFAVGDRLFMPVQYGGLKEVVVSAVSDGAIEIREPMPNGVRVCSYPVHLSEHRQHYGDECVEWGAWDGFMHVAYARQKEVGLS